MPQTIPADWHHLCDDIATSYGRSYRESVERDDLAQELKTWCLSHDEFVQQCVGDEAWSLLAKALRNHATTICRKARAEYMRRTSQHVYNAEAVKVLLELMFQPRGWERGVNEDAIVLDTAGLPMRRNTNSEPAESGSLAVELMDVARAFDALPAEKRRVLTARYGHPEASWFQWAAACDLTEVAFRRASSRALNTLVDSMNGHIVDVCREYTGQRRAMSNEQALRLVA